MIRYYTGVGSRKAPGAILDLMRKIAIRLTRTHDDAIWTLRSGGAAGADKAFESGAGIGRSEIYLAEDATPEAMDIAKRFHPAWDRCSFYAKRLHGRNSFQVLRRSLDQPSSFLVCWTPDGCISHGSRTRQTGGTGTAISIADHYGIPVFNLARPEHFARLTAFVS